ncbi:MAG: DUF1579 family protein [Planctomycetes bacterium]|nr:DUF1579 family protein [Planctomycetota bacterium]
MNTRSMYLAAILTTAGLCAQDDKHAQDMPNPKTEHHAALQQWVGTWKVKGTMDAMPGVPGMEEAVDSEGTETASLICDGLWLKWESVMECNGKQSTGLWLVGYDPFKKQYTSYVVSSDEHCQGLVPLTGTFDAKAKTWTWIGESPEGKMKSVCEFTGKDTLKETLFMVGPDGAEKQFMVMERTRSKDAKPASIANASMRQDPDAADSKHLAVLLNDIGMWDAIVENDCSGETTTEKATEKVHAICDGKWTWTDFQSEYMGQPFTGHALLGWDPTKNEYASLWIDSMSATCCLTSGTYDEKTKTYSFEGSCTGPDGAPMTVEQTATCEGKDQRVLSMKFEHPQMQSTMKITYTRRAAK